MTTCEIRLSFNPCSACSRWTTAVPRGRCTHRQHVADDAAVQLEDVLLVQALVRHVRVVGEPQLHEGGDEELVDVARHHLRLVLLPQHLVYLQRVKGQG